MAILTISGKKVLIDDEDLDKIKHLSWFVNAKNYVQGTKYRGKKRIHAYLHRLIMDCPKGLVVDHLNKNPLDNRKTNLRICTHKQNCYGAKSYSASSMFIGVAKQKNKWKALATIPSKSKVLYIGSFEREIDAAVAYDIYAIREFGIYAKTNFLPPMPQNCKIEIKYFHN